MNEATAVALVIVVMAASVAFAYLGITNADDQENTDG